MAEILIMARDSLSWSSLIVSDTEKAHVGCHKKGDIAVVMEDDLPRGGKEGLPDFIRIKVPQITKEQALGYTAPWTRLVNFYVLVANPPYYEIRISADIVSTSAFETINKEQIKRWLKKQDADILDYGANWVDVAFTLPPYETLQELKDMAMKKLETVKRHQWAIPVAEVDDIIASGGEVTKNKNQMLSIIYSKLDTVDGN